MQTSTRSSYAHLQEHLDAWKNRPRPLTSRSHERFLHTVEEILLPELKRLEAVLVEAGLECTVFRDETDSPVVGIRIDELEATLRLSPGERDASIRAVMSRDGRPNGQIEWLIPYSFIQKGLLEREIQAAMIKTLRSAFSS